MHCLQLLASPQFRFFFRFHAPCARNSTLATALCTSALLLAACRGDNSPTAPSALAVRAIGRGISATVVAGAWTAQALMPTARDGLSATAINGILYAVGGSNNIAIIGTLEAYDPDTDAWTTRAPMPTARRGLGVAAIDGILYAVGGFATDGSTALATVEAYDPATDAWTTKASLPMPLYMPGVAAINGKLYAVGGSNNTPPFWQAAVLAYDPASDTWTMKAPMPTPRTNHGVAAINGKLYAVGGYNGSFLATVEAYDPVADTWATKTSMPTPRVDFAADAVSGTLYALGGYYNDGTNEGPLATVEAYDPATNTWTAKAAMPAALNFPGAASINGTLYAVGGVGSNGIPVSRLNAYGVGPSAQAITFTSTPPIPALTGGTYNVSANGGGSGNSVTFISLTSASCTVSGASVSLLTVGTCTIAADQAGGNGYTAAPQATQSITITSSAQSIAFTTTPPNPALTGSKYNISASGGASGNAVTFTSLTGGVCTVDGSAVSLNAVGTCTVAANQAAGNGYSAATQAEQSFSVTSSSSPAQLIQNAVTLIDQLMASGALSAGNGNSMKAKLNSASTSLANGNNNAALGQLNSLLNQLDALAQTGKLVGPEADALRAQIAQAIAAI